MANLRAKALAKRKPAQMDDDIDYKAMVDEDREIDATDEEKAELAAAKAINGARDEANAAFKSGGKMNNEEFNRQVKARAEALAKKARAKK